MLVKYLLTHLARLVNHKRPGVYAKVMGINELNKLSSEMNIVRMNNRSQHSYQKCHLYPINEVNMTGWGRRA